MVATRSNRPAVHRRQPATRRRRGWLPWLVLAAWLPLLLVTHPLADRLATADRSAPSAKLPRGAQSTDVTIRQEHATGVLADAVVGYARADGLSGDDLRRIAADRTLVTAGPVPGAHPPSEVVTAPGGAAALFRVPVDAGHEAAAVPALRRLLGGPGRDGLRMNVTGPAALTADADDALSGVDDTLLMGTVAVVVILLLLTYRSPVLWLLPLAAVGTSLQVAKAVVYLYGRAGGPLSGLGTAILTVLVFGCGTDYALLLVSRYREELRRHPDRYTAMATALARTWGAVVASGGTVIAAMLCLTAARNGETRGLGPTLALGVAATMATMLTILPALLVLPGRWVFWPSVPRSGDRPRTGGAWWRLSTVIGRRPRLTVLAVLAVLAAMAAGLSTARLDLNPLNQFTSAPDSVAGQRLIARYFSPGAAAPTVVLVPQAQADRAVEVVRGTPGVASVGPGTPLPADGLASLQIVLEGDPYSDRAFATVATLRQRLTADVGAGALVGGPTARQLDRRHAAWHDDLVLVPLILVVIVIVLGLLLRAVTGALAVVASVLVSFAAAIGVSAVVFRWVFGFAGTSAEIPLYAFLFLVALGVDYTIFLMQRVREESASTTTAEGMRRALVVTGGVITSAGVVLAGTFAVLIVLPVTQFAEVGFAVSFGVLLDTFVVRSVLVPAIVFGLGERTWWPARRTPPGRPEVCPKGHGPITVDLPRLPLSRNTIHEGRDEIQ